MTVEIGWIDRPKNRPGLDNLGTQQPCVAIYSRLLPGITNVTDRAAYFGFYPWFVVNFEHRWPGASEAEFRNTLRLADCLVTLIAERHAIALGEDHMRHSGACPGRNTLGPVAQALESGGEVDLARYADRAEGPDRYFKNALGGLGQYYLGPLREEYQILRGDPQSGVGFWQETAEPLAAAFSTGLDEEAFFAALTRKTVSIDELGRLSSFCPCQLHVPGREPANGALISLLLKSGARGGESRANSLVLMLDFFNRTGGATTSDAVKSFLSSCYCGVAAGVPWPLSPALERVRLGWALYARNEMLSLAWLRLFKAALDALDGAPKPFASVVQLAASLLSPAKLKIDPQLTFAELLKQDRDVAPPVENLDHQGHELAMWRALLAGRSDSASAPVAAALLVRLINRSIEEDADPYAVVDLPAGALDPYPLTLRSLKAAASDRWAGLNAEEWVSTLVCDALIAHQRIAVRKLGQSGEDTLMFRSNDLGFFVSRSMDRVVETAPRLRQAVQVLRDLGLLNWSPGSLPVLTDQGLRELEGRSQ